MRLGELKSLAEREGDEKSKAFRLTILRIGLAVVGIVMAIGLTILSPGPVATSAKPSSVIKEIAPFLIAAIVIMIIGKGIGNIGKKEWGAGVRSFGVAIAAITIAIGIWHWLNGTPLYTARLIDPTTVAGRCPNYLPNKTLECDITPVESNPVSPGWRIPARMTYTLCINVPDKEESNIIIRRTGANTRTLRTRKGIVHIRYIGEPGHVCTSDP